MRNRRCPQRGHCWGYRNENCEGCSIGKEVTRLHKKIERLEKKNARLEQELAEAKRSGTWVGLEYDGYADGFPVFDLWECSACGNEWRGDEPPCFCPDCGAKMETE